MYVVIHIILIASALTLYCNIDPHHVLRAPHHKNYKPNEILRRKIGTYLAAIVHARVDRVILHLPEVIPLWGKMRLQDSGDVIRTSFAKMTESERNNRFIRVSHHHYYNHCDSTD
jgi:hypothetical protein